MGGAGWQSFLVVSIMVAMVTSQTSNYSINLVFPSDCLGTDGGYYRFYNISHMECAYCRENSTVQTTAQDGISCRCTKPYKAITIHQTSSGTTVKIRTGCEHCTGGQVASKDGWACTDCATQQAPTPDDACPACQNPAAITASRNLTGYWYMSGNQTATLTCIACANLTLPNDNPTRCVRCNEVLSVQSGSGLGCNCPDERLSGGLCFNNSADLVPATSEYLYRIYYDTTIYVDSQYYYNNIRATHGICSNYSSLDSQRYDYSNLTACQMLGNLCALTMYINDPTHSENPCGLFLAQVTNIQAQYPPHNPGYRTSAIAPWVSSMPWLFYEATETMNALEDNTIPETFTDNSTLRIRAASYTLEGNFLGIRDVTLGQLMLCKNDPSKMLAAFRFGTYYKKECDIAVDYLFNGTTQFFNLIFRDLWLEYTDAQGVAQLIAIPMVLKNYVDQNGDTINQNSDRSTWQLLRRFFLIDRISGIPIDGVSPDVIRYLERLRFVVTLQKDNKQGKIYPPYVELSYNYVLKSNFRTNKFIRTHFAVEYRMDMATTDRQLSITLGVMAGLAVLYAAFLTATWNRRDGRIAIDFFTIAKFIVLTADTLANTFFVVMLGFSLWWLIFYKVEYAMYLVPDSGGTYYVEAFVGSAFALKFLGIVNLIVKQVTIDIFFIDWERPRKTLNDDLMPQGPLSTHDIANDVDASQAVRNLRRATPRKKKEEVSIWRTYFVANEFTEIQTKRRIDVFLELFLVMLILYVIGVGNISRANTIGWVVFPDYVYQPPYNKVFRFAMAISVYMTTGLALYLWDIIIWSRYVDSPISNFIDLCSTSNISVVLMSHNLYGYYVHGRSVHGQADVDLRTMYSNLNREQANLCGHRGLEPGTDHQTFDVVLPNKFRVEYNRILYSTWRSQIAGAMGGRPLPPTPSTSGRTVPEVEKRFNGYDRLNKFFINFLDHNIQSLDYVIRSKNIAERIMNTEFIKNMEMGYFYTDIETSFTDVLFYGNEICLQIFEMLWFAVMDMATQNFLTAAILTYVLHDLMKRLCIALSRRNITKKTMINEKLLI